MKENRRRYLEDPANVLGQEYTPHENSGYDDDFGLDEGPGWGWCIAAALLVGASYFLPPTEKQPQPISPIPGEPLTDVTSIENHGSYIPNAIRDGSLQQLMALPDGATVYVPLVHNAENSTEVYVVRPGDEGLTASLEHIEEFCEPDIRTFYPREQDDPIVIDPIGKGDVEHIYKNIPPLDIEVICVNDGKKTNSNAQ